MAAVRGRAELQRQWKERDISPERTKVWTEPRPRTMERKVPVVYYLSRNGQLEHPHFMEVPLSSADGLYLKDAANRLDSLRGKGLASLYSWSSKRSYKNGFVWHDLSEDDLIHPVHGHEYVLKGSELLHVESSSSSSERPAETPTSRDDSELPLGLRKKTTWSSLDLNEYKVYKADLASYSAAKAAADASTQTDDRKQRRRALQVPDEQPPAELNSDEISPPPSSSSPETLESLMKSDGRGISIAAEDQDRTVGSSVSGRMRASAVLINLISCGSISVKDHGGIPVTAQYKMRLPRGGSDQVAKETMDGLMDNPSFSAIQLEDKEYFSGSFIEIKKKGCDGVAAEFPALKRSSSCNADRSSKIELLEKEIEGVRAKCIPRKPRQIGTTRKDGSSNNNSSISRSAHGSKRFNEEIPQPPALN
ncbi:hypothetical protein J5N97_030101 [Dioscorea zingiberensis]|uniref:SOSEKI DIX-like domain-containing protein n=1 Tax=Dioscorea zingiberensis TaxID=325984 RepID=A0A9D5BX17_9LILI|nr:hypothetical protein J5N97_030101 [Dioscorea zingiberensis]